MSKRKRQQPSQPAQPAPDNWYATVRDLTERLVHINSVSPGAGETQVASEVVRLLSEGNLASVYREIGLDPIENDPHQRQNAYAFLQGNGKQAIVLLGHIDTVGTEDYGELERWALDSDALLERQQQLAAITPGLQEDLDAHPNDWMFGRGSIDMKSGVAANIAVMRRWAEAARTALPALSIVLLATPDEENESAGVLQAVRLLLRLRETYGLEYLGAINTDYTTSLYPGDPHRYIYTGTIGKLLPSFYIVGGEGHVGAPFDGLDVNLLMAELIRDLSMSEDLCDMARGQVTPPPVTLHASDLKQRYNVQIPFTAHFYLNVLTFNTQPDDLLLRLCHRAEASLSRVLQRMDASEQNWLRMSGETERAARLLPRAGRVLTYAELYHQAVATQGEMAVAQALDEEWDRWPASLDKRERSLHLVERLWSLSGLRGPAVVVYYAPPFYPHVKATSCALHEAIAAMAQAHPEVPLVTQEYFTFLSDMSYLRLDAGIDTTALTENMPVWQDATAPLRPGGYSLPLEEIRQLALPVVNLGPYGRGAHQRGERVLMSYSFGVLPQLVHETIERLATTS